MLLNAAGGLMKTWGVCSMGTAAMHQGTILAAECECDHPMEELHMTLMACS